jgi:poly(A) polymerase
VKLDDRQKQRILTAGVNRLMEVLRPEGEARVVGGAVRDVVMGRVSGDIDMAVNLPPDRMVALLGEKSIKTVPTGLAHGTLTAVVDHVGYEITSLRHDVETDGRHARVAFTDDWRADATRRDFTFNALYCDVDGTVYDYFTGLDDAREGRVRFIGEACARINEDVLRILRFFRFHAWFAKTEPDAEGLRACRELAHLIPRLSAERVARETLKLLAAENPLPAWQLMIENGILPHFLPETTDTARLQNLLANEKQYSEAFIPLTRLSALLPPDQKIAAATAMRFKLSSRDGDRLRVLALLPTLVQTDASPLALRRLLYKYGSAACRAALLIGGMNIDDALLTVTNWENPIFPLKGEDIVKLGIPAGPHIGEILREAEAWWVAGDFRASHDICLTHAQAYMEKHSK